MPNLFVIMPFGKKKLIDENDLPFDFDEVYKQIIRPAGLERGWEVLRIDEVSETGQIAEQYLKEIMSADLVLADISIPNANVFYELGIRHAISAGGTILIAREGSNVPFDLASHRVVFYDPDFANVNETKEQIQKYLVRHSSIPFQNPIKAFLEKVGARTTPQKDIVAFEKEITGRIDRSRTVDEYIAVWHWLKNYNPLPTLPLITLAEKISNFGEWLLATEILKTALVQSPSDFEIYRKIGWYLQQLGPGWDAASLEAFEKALFLNPYDPETLGMMGGRLKRLEQYSEAEVFYDKAASVSPNSIYILINQAAIKILKEPNDCEDGKRLYKDLISRIEKTGGTAPDEWNELVLGEAFFVTGDLASARKHYSNALDLASTPKSIGSAVRQLQTFASKGYREEEARGLINFLQNGKAFARSETTGGALSNQDETNLPIIIHLSDVHFGTKEKDGIRKSIHRFFDGENSQSLSSHLIQELTGKSSRVKGQQDRFQLVVSGDLTYNGSKEEFEEAKLFLNEVCDKVGINKGKVHLIPGNHDVNWLLAKHDISSRFDNYINFLVEFYGEELFTKKYPKIKWPIFKHDPSPHPYEIVSYYYSETSKLLIVGFNSCVYEDDQHHYGFIGERQLKLVKGLMEDNEISTDITRIALIHHHLHPFPELLAQREVKDVWLDLSTIRDAGLVERYLERLEFDLVLHGHKHKAQIRETVVRDPDPSILKADPRSLIVCGAGSISCTELEHNESSHYEIIELRQHFRTRGAQFLKIEWRVMPVSPGAEWRTLKSWDLVG